MFRSWCTVILRPSKIALCRLRASLVSAATLFVVLAVVVSMSGCQGIDASDVNSEAAKKTSGSGSTTVAVANNPNSVQQVDYRLRNFALDRERNVLGSWGSGLFRIPAETTHPIPVHEFPARINAVHVTDGGAIVVATDANYWNPDSLCQVWLSRDDGASFDEILRLEGGSAIWWSITSDARERLYVGEYGPKIQGVARRVLRSSDGGQSWQSVFSTNPESDAHVHRVAIDPYTQDIWITTGDGRRNRGVYRSVDDGRNFEKLLKSQATAIGFTEEAVLLGEDHLARGGVRRFDRASGKTRWLLEFGKMPNAGGSIYSLLAQDDGTVFAPTVKYPQQRHRAVLWVRRDGRWQALVDAPERADGSAGFETLAGPDRNGWYHVTGFRFR